MVLSTACISGGYMEPIEVLSKFSFFADLSKQAQEKLIQQSKIIFDNAKHSIVKKGDHSGGVVLVQEGQLRVYTITESAKESTLYWVDPGESCILSINSVFSDTLFPAWVDSCILSINSVFSDTLFPAWVDMEKTFTRFVIIPSALYRELFATEPALQKFTFEILSTRIFDLVNSLEEATLMSLDKRLANFFLRRANSNHTLAMSHEQIATHLGTAREVVTRIIKKFEQKKLVEVGRGYTRILDVSGLREELLPDQAKHYK